MIVIKMIGRNHTVMVKRIDSSAMHFSKRALVDDPEFDESIQEFLDEGEDAASILALMMFDDESFCIKSNVIDYEVYVDGILMIRS